MKQGVLNFHFIKESDVTVCISEKNFFAFNAINSWPNWSNNLLYIYGPKDCGKSLILNMWKMKSRSSNLNLDFFNDLSFLKNLKSLEEKKCWSIDNIDKIISNDNEEKILNVINILKSNDSSLLITSSKSPKELKCKLDDLLSRLNSSIVAEVKQPDESLIKEIIKRKLEIREIIIDDKNLDFLVKRMERTYSNAIKISEMIDKKSLEEHSNISKRLFRKILEELEL